MAPAAAPLGEIVRDPTGPRPFQIRFRPDGKWLAWLQERAGPDRLTDLWGYEIATGRKVALLRAEGPQRLSPEEQAARERRREGHLGLSSYEWNPEDGSLLLPIDGDLWRLKEGSLERITQTPEPELEAAWSPDGRSLAWVSAGNLHVDGRALTTEGGGKVRCGLAEFIAQEELGRQRGFWWSPDGRRIAYVRTDSTGVPLFPMQDPLHGTTLHQEYPRAGDANVSWRLGVLPAAGGPTVWMQVEGEYLVRADWSPDGALLAQVADRAQTHLGLWRCDPESGEARLLLEETDPAWVDFHDDLRFLPGGDLLWTSQRSGRRLAYRWHDGALTPLESGEVDRVLSVKGGSVRVLGPSGVRTLGGPSIDAKDEIASPDGRHSVRTFSAAGISPRIGLFLEERPIVWLSDSRETPRPEFVTIPAEDGTPLQGMLIRARKPGRRPAIVHVYGGPGARLVADRWGGTTWLWHQRLADLGYNVFTLDNRGSGGRGRDFTRLVKGRLCDLEVRDQVAGARWLQSQPFVDADRIAIWGWSFGGTMTLMCLLQAPEVFRAGCAVAPVTDWREYDTAYTERYLGLPSENPEGYRLSSPITFAATLRRPLLLVHGFLDDNVHFVNAVAFLDAAKGARRWVESDFWPRGAHGIGGPAEREVLFGRIERFLFRSLDEAR